MQVQAFLALGTLKVRKLAGAALNGLLSPALSSTRQRAASARQGGGEGEETAGSKDAPVIRHHFKASVEAARRVSART